MREKERELAQGWRAEEKARAYTEFFD